ncbi:hypothetical protein P175DRAFT_0247939 [Aspergillus ochraceoroseus IBT 24754]|uniref:Uncharacterized protein n=1 Tax=Aspergillus ochraceoroseus IBT 24754 TaxID=1392256 RepID=A0A2T5LXZ1_9EURO|nr:uncharacterized protein P175DRAFT_0247939 [Aspergillus ochraceoroseus IBT 24754]PTU21155.1 hypothetical protein P175DRAFT_0247939 [Aspergillus ochraceoroseus IBT 24754]
MHTSPNTASLTGWKLKSTAFYLYPRTHRVASLHRLLAAFFLAFHSLGRSSSPYFYLIPTPLCIPLLFLPFSFSLSLSPPPPLPPLSSFF